MPGYSDTSRRTYLPRALVRAARARWRAAVFRQISVTPSAGLVTSRQRFVRRSQQAAPQPALVRCAGLSAALSESQVRRDETASLRLPASRGPSLGSLAKPGFPAGAAHSMRASAQVTAPGAVTSMIVAVSTRLNRQDRSTCSCMLTPLVQIQILGLVDRSRRLDRLSRRARRGRPRYDH